MIQKRRKQWILKDWSSWRFSDKISPFSRIISRHKQRERVKQACSLTYLFLLHLLSQDVCFWGRFLLRFHSRKKVIWEKRKVMREMLARRWREQEQIWKLVEDWVPTNSTWALPPLFKAPDQVLAMLVHLAGDDPHSGQWRRYAARGEYARS